MTASTRTQQPHQPIQTSNPGTQRILGPSRTAGRRYASWRILSYRGRHVHRLEESLYGTWIPAPPIYPSGTLTLTNDRPTLNSSGAPRCPPTQEVSFFLSDGSVTSINTGVRDAAPFAERLSEFHVPTIEGDRELEIESDLGVEALWLASYFRIAAVGVGLRARCAHTPRLDAHSRFALRSFARRTVSTRPEGCG
jgi:hypothetical protein